MDVGGLAGRKAVAESLCFAEERIMKHGFSGKESDESRESANLRRPRRATVVSGILAGFSSEAAPFARWV